MTRPVRGHPHNRRDPCLGQTFCDTDSALAEHGYDADRIAAFRGAKVI